MPPASIGTERGTSMATKAEGVPCYDKAAQTEPLFVLRAQDLSSPGIVITWIRANIYTASDEKLRGAFECALKMRNRPYRKVAD